MRSVRNGRGKKSSFYKLIKFCKENGNEFGSKLLDYSSVKDLDIIYRYLNMSMPNICGYDFIHKMLTDTLSTVSTVGEEAFSLLVFENNFNRWVFLADKELDREEAEKKMLEETNDETNGDGNNEDRV